MTSEMSAEEIQRQMGQIRCELHEEMQTIVDNARELTDWHYYVRNYPWVCMGAAAALGYFIVPHARRITVSDPSIISELEKTREMLLEATGKPKKKGLIASAIALGTGALVQGGTALLKKQLENYLRQRQMQAAHHRPPTRMGET